MAKAIYPIILHPEKEGGYSVDVPDLNIGTQGETVAECIDMARDAIGLWGICQQDDHKPIPAPSTLTPHCDKGNLVTLVDIDFDAYRRANDMRTVRRMSRFHPGCVIWRKNLVLISLRFFRRVCAQSCMYRKDNKQHSKEARESSLASRFFVFTSIAH